MNVDLLQNCVELVLWHLFLVSFLRDFAVSGRCHDFILGLLKDKFEKFNVVIGTLWLVFNEKFLKLNHNAISVGCKDKCRAI